MERIAKVPAQAENNMLCALAQSLCFMLKQAGNNALVQRLSVVLKTVICWCRFCVVLRMVVC